MSISGRRHNFKAGFLSNATEDGAGHGEYMGNFNFGLEPNNPLSWGNGYANMLLGVFTTYTERPSASTATSATGRTTCTSRTAGA